MYIYIPMYIYTHVYIYTHWFDFFKCLDFFPPKTALRLCGRHPPGRHQCSHGNLAFSVEKMEDDQWLSIEIHQFSP